MTFDSGSAGSCGAKDITLVIPSRNEAGSLEVVVRQWYDQRAPGGTLRLLVVDDASTDGTAQLLDRLQQELPVRSVRTAEPLGFGGSLRRGITEVETPWVAFTDADGQYDPKDLRTLLALLDAGNDLALGVRTPRADPFVRIVISIGFRGLLYAFFRAPLRDPTSSLRVGRTEAIRWIAERTRYMNGSFWNEFMVRWVREGLTFAQAPVRHLPRLDGQSKVAARGLVVRVSLQQFIALLRLWRELHRLRIANSATSPSTAESR
jgi:dolichol-phosphate mannosyltransferase